MEAGAVQACVSSTHSWQTFIHKSNKSVG